MVKELGVDLAAGNHLPVGPDLTLEGFLEVFVVGDVALITDGKTAETLPQLGSVDVQAGHYAGVNIARHIEGKSVKQFKYLDKGTMATIAAGTAIL